MRGSKFVGYDMDLPPRDMTGDVLTTFITDVFTRLQALKHHSVDKATTSAL